jgi:uncharacterized membrane protein YagU involved in acid resistance
MPTHAKISIEPGIRELFLKQELLDFLGNQGLPDWLVGSVLSIFLLSWVVVCVLFVFVLCPVSCVLCQISSHVMCKNATVGSFLCCVFFFICLPLVSSAPNGELYSIQHWPRSYGSWIYISTYAITAYPYYNIISLLVNVEEYRSDNQ